MTNICTNHEREALNLIEHYADNSKKTPYGTVKWIELNDTKYQLTWGRVVKVKLDWWTDGTGWFCSVDVLGNDGILYDGLLMRDESDTNQQHIVNIICDWSADMIVCTPDDIRNILTDMVDYALDCEDDELQEYFMQIVNTGLFHDAIGKIVATDEGGKVLVTKSY